MGIRDLDIPLEFRMKGDRINGLFHLLIHGDILALVHPLIRSPLIPALPGPGTSKYCRIVDLLEDQL